MLSLKDCLTLPDEYNWGGRVDTPDGPYYHHQHGSNVLGVAHLDTVLKARPYKDGQYVFAPQLDDRLGVWCLLNKLPRMGIHLDVLLTTGEERCNSTAQHFTGQYNWVVEFDRAGTDIVFYHYDEDEWQDCFSEFPIGQGSYSDIVDMDIACAANIGIGYHSQHTRYCWADLRETQLQLNRFARMYNKHKGNYFPCINWSYTHNSQPLPYSLANTPQSLIGLTTAKPARKCLT